MHRTETDVSVKIRSTVYHLIGNPEEEADDAVFIGWDEEEQPAVLPADNAQSERVVKDIIRYDTDGTLTVEDDTVTLSYEESEELGMEGCRVAVQFGLQDPTEVSMTRAGNAEAGLTFSMSQPRQHCVYQTGVVDFPLDLCIRSRRVENGISARGGVLYLDYVIEMRGVCTERTVMRIQVKPR